MSNRTYRNYAMNPVTIGLHKDARYEIQRTNTFEMVIYLPPAVRQAYQAMGIGKEEEANQVMTLSISAASLPTVTQAPIAVPYNNLNVYYAGNFSFSGAQELTLNDYIGADTQSLCKMWQNLVGAPETGQVGWAQVYKTRAKIMEYAQDGSCSTTWWLVGVWPTSINYGGTLQRGEASLKAINMTLQYDLAFPRWDETARKYWREASALTGTTLNNAAFSMMYGDMSGYDSEKGNEDVGGGPLNNTYQNFDSM